ncbi:uncharacterized protein LOC18446567 isoform X2 [Amborella trichopoda]|uniref:uncharacterized protein LOC18446567 isoform X2 n=1 Tax=Amborella trichopoda TaxID=13333 RepID=UPI0009BDB3FD|nr:uncharacterized protein LOC18446567 isoform X2 [Amborella trichopoda]|eukprot:XP_020530686.1 uncharacterized protein LOC18446567 isoform X2 [Amborella trichopoda]
MKNAMIAATKRPIDYPALHIQRLLLACPCPAFQFFAELSAQISHFSTIKTFNSLIVLRYLHKLVGLQLSSKTLMLVTCFIKKQSHHNLPSEGKTLEEKVKTDVLEERFSKGPQCQSDGLINVCNSCFTLLYA